MGSKSLNEDRNAYMLKRSLLSNGYDWWWHSFTGYNAETGLPRTFFIEYFVINPDLGGERPILGQLPENKAKGIKPAYAMIKAGAWGEDKSQINNYYGIKDFKASDDKMEVCIGKNYADENTLYGSVSLTKEQCEGHPEYMSDFGEMLWDLKLKKVLSYSVGYGASKLMRTLNAFHMYWHVQGMLTQYEGTVHYKGEKYNVIPEKSYGYQDKNWGRDFTNPWIWLNCNNFKSEVSGEIMEQTSLDIGGGCPIVFGVKLPRKVLAAFYYKGKLYEYNFSKVFQGVKQEIDCRESGDAIIWNITAKNRTSKIEVSFICEKDSMIKVNYENPKGEKNHSELWNGGLAKGMVKLYEKRDSKYVLIDELYGKNGGCEFGHY